MSLEDARWVMVAGDIRDGIEVHGPYENYLEAADARYDVDTCGGGAFAVVMPLLAPEVDGEPFEPLPPGPMRPGPS